MILLKKENCVSCAACADACMFGAISMNEGFPVLSDKCVSCGMCVSSCPAEALYVSESTTKGSSLKEYKGIWAVSVENGRLKNSSLELLSAAAGLSNKNGDEITLVCFGELSDDEKKRVSGTGCRNVLLFPSEGDSTDFDYRTGAITQAVNAKKPGIVLFSATADGRDIAPKVAVRLKTGLTADCTGLDIDENGDLLQIRPTYGGNIMATIRTPDRRPQMATVRPGVFDIQGSSAEFDLNIVKFEVKPEESFGRIIRTGRRENNESFADVEEAQIILAGGYGLESRENFQLLYKLADKLGAAVAATRKAVDEGWAPSEIQVGQTGKTVLPTVYIAFGISGALQHMLGMKKARKIIAVNNDPAAPIFSICDKAIFADAAEVIKEMLRIL